MEDKEALEEMGQVVVDFIDSNNLIKIGASAKGYLYSDDARLKLGMLFSEIADQGARHVKEA